MKQSLVHISRVITERICDPRSGSTTVASKRTSFLSAVVAGFIFANENVGRSISNDRNTRRDVSILFNDLVRRYLSDVILLGKIEVALSEGAQCLLAGFASQKLCLHSGEETWGPSHKASLL